MKNTYQNMAKKLVFLRKNLTILFSNWLNSLKKYFSFYNKNTELLAIWTLLFLTITGLFVIGINSKLPIVLFLIALSLAITFIAIIAATYYLHALKYHKKKQFLPKVHNFLNKSFKLRTLIKFIKIPYKIKFKHLFKLNFKIAP